MCSGTRPEPFQAEYCYISITQTAGSTYSAYFCPQLNCTLFTAVWVGGGQEGWELLSRPVVCISHSEVVHVKIKVCGCCTVPLRDPLSNQWWCRFCIHVFLNLNHVKRCMCILYCGCNNNKMFLLFLPSLSIPTLRHFMKRQA